MVPAKFDFKMYRGDSYSWRFILWKDDEKTDPVDLTDTVIELEIRDKIDGVIILPMLCQLTLPNIVDVSMTPDMYGTCPAKGVWDMQITFPNEEVHTPIGGTVVVSPDVTLGAVRG